MLSIKYIYIYSISKYIHLFFSGLSDFAPYFHENGNMALCSISEDTPVGEGLTNASYTLMDTHSV